MAVASVPAWTGWWRAARVFGCVALLGCLAGSSAWDWGSADDASLGYLPVAGTSALDRARVLASSEAAAPGGQLKRWIVLCWDGASWDLILPLLDAGKMPHLASLMAQGTSSNLFTIQPTLSPVVWTSIATGVSPSRHGIAGLQKGRATASEPDPGSPLYDNSDRRAKALWNLVSGHGSVVVSGYHATFPVEAVNGVMVSNYLVRRDHALHYASAADERTAASHFVYPSSAFEELRTLERQVRDVRWEDLSRFASVSPEEFNALMAQAGPIDTSAGRWPYLSKAYVYDTFYAEAALRFARRLRPMVTLVHFQSLDWAGHRFLYFHSPEQFLNLGPIPSPWQADAVRYRPAVAGFYEYADEWLGRFLQERDADTAVMLLSDHGMQPIPNAPGGGHEDAPPGVLVMQGPGIRSGHRLRGATLYDVLPTLLATLGIPLARDLEGRVLAEAFEASGRDRMALSYVETYGAFHHAGADGAGAASAARMREEFRAVGYIQ